MHSHRLCAARHIHYYVTGRQPLLKIILATQGFSLDIVTAQGGTNESQKGFQNNILIDCQSQVAEQDNVISQALEISTRDGCFRGPNRA